MAKIAICIPHNYPNFEKYFVFSLLSVVGSFHEWNKTIGNKHELIILNNKEGWIDFMREQLADEALKQGADYLMWVDTDMTFPPSMIQCMMAWFEKDPSLDAVTGLYTWKQPPFLPHVYARYVPEDDKFTVAGAFPLNGGFNVEGAGFGCVMIKADLFKRTERPWFKYEYGVYGEDLYFFKKARPVNMICDTRITCKHYQTLPADIDCYLRSNNLKVEEGMIEASQETLDRISDFQEKLSKTAKKFQR